MDFLQITNGQHPIDEFHYLICNHFFYMFRKILSNYEEHSDILTKDQLQYSVPFLQISFRKDPKVIKNKTKSSSWD